MADDSGIQAELAAVRRQMLARRRQKAQKYVLKRVAGLRSYLHPGQLTILDDDSRFKTVCCGRRWGKSIYDAIQLLVWASRTKALYPFISMTRENAELVIWPALQEIDLELKLGLSFNHSKLRASLPNGSQILVGGCNDRRSVERWRGPKYGGVILDECQSWAEYLADLWEKILRPALADLKGPAVFSGTPGRRFTGFWFNLAGPPERQNHAGKRPVRPWPVFEGNMRENPHMVDPEAELRDVLVENGWLPDNPDYLREWEGQWVEDLGGLVFPYTPELNGAPELPPAVARRWEWVLGVDVGYVDECAFVLLAKNVERPEVYMVKSWKQAELLTGQVAHEIRKVLEATDSHGNRLHPGCRVVMDTGGMGKQHAAECRRRFGIPVIPARKRDKAAHIRMMRSQLLSGLFKVLDGPDNDAWRDEASVLPWDTDKLLWPDGYSDHAIDAGVYAHDHLHHYVVREPDDVPNYGTDAWAQRESARMKQERAQKVKRRQKAKKVQRWSH